MPQDLRFTVRVYGGGEIDEDLLIMSETFDINLDIYFDESHLSKLIFAKPVKIVKRRKYTITLQANRDCLSYFGVNGKKEISHFRFADAKFGAANSSLNNSTSLCFGQLPLFYVEV